MKSQKSSMHEEGSCLYLVATPIGNLEDMTMRAIRILKEADIIAAEDTRNTKKLCNYFEIETPLVSYHDHNKEQGGEKLLQFLREGKTVALVSDAGLACDNGRISVNGRVVKASYDVKVGDKIEISMGTRTVAVEVLEVADNVRKDDAAGMLLPFTQPVYL